MKKKYFFCLTPRILTIEANNEEEAKKIANEQFNNYEYRVFWLSRSPEYLGSEKLNYERTK